MRKSFLCILVTIILIFSISFAEASFKESTLDDPPHKFPGEMNTAYPDFPYPKEPQDTAHRIPHPISTPTNDIIEIIQQLNETLYLDYLEDLVAFGPRRTGTQACWDAGDWIYDEFATMGLQVRYQNWSYFGESGSNIEATLPGQDPSSDEIYVICAHYDSVTGSPGADDDGSGTVAVLTAAHIMRNFAFNHTIRFVTFSGEEQGLYGSHEYVLEAYNNGDNIIAALNVDMIGYALSNYDGSHIQVFNNDVSYWLYSFTQSISNQYMEFIELTTNDSGWTWGSDHYNFWEYGYDAIFYHEYTFNEYYHSPQDTIENMNITYAVKSTKLILATLGELAQSLTSGNPPEKPIVTGPTETTMGITANFTITSTDPEDHALFYFILWDDGTSTGWIGPYPSGETIIIDHIWYTSGEYAIQVRARNINYTVSDWSNPHTITILKGPLFSIESITGGLLTISADVTNIGEATATNIEWTITTQGGFLLLHGEKTGTIPSLPVDSPYPIKSGWFLGFGKTTITITVQTTNGLSTSQKQPAQIFLLIILISEPGGT